MPYSHDDVRRISQMLQSYREREEAVVDQVLMLGLQSAEGQQYAKHGLIRRFHTMRWCIDRVFNVLPIAEADPERDALIEAAVLLQAFLMHVTGVMDNLARIWCLERGLVNEDVAAIPDIEIGLGPRCRRVRALLNPAFRDHLQRADDWFGYLKNYRDAFAHRIPLYIPPRVVGPQDEERYRELEAEQLIAWQRCDYPEAARLFSEMDRVGRFDPMMMHAFGNRPADGRPVRLHPQMICDYAAVVEIAELMLAELKIVD